MRRVATEEKEGARGRTKLKGRGGDEGAEVGGSEGPKEGKEASEK